MFNALDFCSHTHIVMHIEKERHDRYREKKQVKPPFDVVDASPQPRSRRRRRIYLICILLFYKSLKNIFDHRMYECAIA